MSGVSPDHTGQDNHTTCNVGALLTNLSPFVKRPSRARIRAASASPQGSWVSGPTSVPPCPNSGRGTAYDRRPSRRTPTRRSAGSQQGRQQRPRGHTGAFGAFSGLVERFSSTSSRGSRTPASAVSHAIRAELPRLPALDVLKPALRAVARVRDHVGELQGAGGRYPPCALCRSGQPLGGGEELHGSSDEPRPANMAPALTERVTERAVGGDESLLDGVGNQLAGAGHVLGAEPEEALVATTDRAGRIEGGVLVDARRL